MLEEREREREREKERDVALSEREHSLVFAALTALSMGEDDARLG